MSRKEKSMVRRMRAEYVAGRKISEILRDLVKMRLHHGDVILLAETAWGIDHTTFISGWLAGEISAERMDEFLSIRVCIPPDDE